MKRGRVTLGAFVSLVPMLLATVVAGAEPVRYDNYRIVRVQADSISEIDRAGGFGRMLSCHAHREGTEFLIAPDRMAEFERAGFKFEVLTANAQAEIDEQDRLRELARTERGATFYSDYATYDEMNTHIDSIVALNPAIANKFVIGFALEGNPIYAMSIVAPQGGAGVAQRPQVAITGCQHAREWVAPMAVIYAFEELVTNYGVDPQLTDLVDNVEFYFVPVVNPDGFIYSQTDRYWRKNRRNNGNGTFGVDLNRNWGYQWGAGLPGSSSGTPSSETYRGTAAWSEPETVVVRDFLASLTNLKGHVDTHTYSQLILGPWGYDDTIIPPREFELRATQEEMEFVMDNTAGANYAAGLGNDQLLYTADGIMPDWTFGVLNALSWTFELRPSQGQGLSGFSPPPSAILPGAQEAFNGYLVLAQNVQKVIELDEGTAEPFVIPTETAVDVDVDVVLWNQSQLEANSQKLLYRVGTKGPFTEVALSGGPGTYSGSLPPVPCGETIQYYFQAEATTGQIATLPNDAPNSLFETTSAIVDIGFQDNFETNLGWTTGGVATAGHWQRGVPIGGGTRGDPPTDFDGSGQCYLTQNGAGNTDVDGGSVILTSPPFDLSEGGTVSYAYWLDDYTGVFGTGDGMAVQVATDDPPTNWAQVRFYSTGEPVWKTDEIIVGSEVAPSSTLRVRFIASDPDPGHVVEAAVDAVLAQSVQPCPPTGCEGDADGSNSVDVNDISYIVFRLGAVAPNDEGADVDGSSSVDVNDISYAVFRLGTCNPI